MVSERRVGLDENDEAGRMERARLEEGWTSPSDETQCSWHKTARKHKDSAVRSKDLGFDNKVFIVWQPQSNEPSLDSGRTFAYEQKSRGVEYPRNLCLDSTIRESSFHFVRIHPLQMLHE